MDLVRDCQASKRLLSKVHPMNESATRQQQSHASAGIAIRSSPNRAGIGIGFLLFLTLLAQTVSAADPQPTEPQLTEPQNDAPVIEVQEDWRIVIGTPNEREYAPQIVTIMSPTDHLRDLHAIFELNHSTLPEALPGGLQLQLWRRDFAIQYRSFPRFHVLASPDETIEFTSSMSVDDGSITFEIRNGNSKTWGQFGSRGHLKQRQQTNLTELRDYRPETSIQNSFVGFASHRVRKMVLHEVRYYSAEGLTRRDTTSRIAHEHESE